MTKAEAKEGARLLRPLCPTLRVDTAHETEHTDRWAVVLYEEREGIFHPLLLIRDMRDIRMAEVGPPTPLSMLTIEVSIAPICPPHEFAAAMQDAAARFAAGYLDTPRRHFL